LRKDGIGLYMLNPDDAASIRNFIVYWCDLAAYCENGDPAVDYFCLYLNTVNFVANHGYAGDSTLSSTDPQFVVVDGDYHLKYSSHCINAGVPNVHNDPDGSRNDMGLYGGEYAWSPFYALIPLGANNFSGTLLQDTYRVSGNILITNNVHFTIEPGSILEFDADKGIVVESGGRITADGNGNLPITMNSYLGADRWNGINLEDGSLATATLSYISLDHAKNGVICENDTLNTPINHCDFTDCNGDATGSKGVYLDLSNTGVRQCTFSECEIGISLYRSGSKVDSNEVVVQDYGVFVNNSLSYDLEYNTLTNRQDNGNFGVYMVDAGAGWLIGNKIDSVSTGIYLENSDPKLRDNTVDTCGVGLHLISASQPVMTFITGGDANNRASLCDSNEVFITGTLYPLIYNGHNDLVKGGDHRYTIYSTVNNSQTYSYDVGGNFWDLDTRPEVRAVIYPPDFTGYTISVSTVDGTPNTYSLTEDSIAFGISLEAQNLYDQAYAFYQNLISDNPNDPLAITALRRMFCCAGALNNYNGLYDDYVQMASSINEPENLFNLNRMKGNTLRANGSYEEALTLFNELLQNTNNLTDSVFVLMDIENTLYDQQQAGGNGLSSLGNNFTAYMNRMQELRQILESTPNNQIGHAVEIPSEIQLMNAYPNPFNPQTNLSFSLPEANLMNLSIYDITGRLVATLVDGWRESGYHTVTFNASELASGLYFCRLKAGESLLIQKIVLLK
jgi:parallel beta-helix repeat protein